jgi:hypothetical protein
MARSAGHPKHRFEDWQVWPGSYNNPPVDGIYRFPPDPRFTITRQTPIGSMGSCFAREIKRKLNYFGFNYIQEESEHPAAAHASAAWERTYNTFSMRQIFEYSFEEWRPTPRWWIAPQSGKVQDPYRRIICYDTLEQAEANLEQHRVSSRRALEQAEVFIITLGLTEIWQDQDNGAVICLPSGPYVNEGGDMSRYRFRVSRYQENLDNLEKIQALMATHNPNCKLLVTVSPVHLWATFRRDLDVLSASCNSKSTLRAVADEFVTRHDNVYYFPSYEMATIYTPLMGKSWLTDDRENFHVNKLTVRFIMRQFFRIFAPDETIPDEKAR